MARVLYIYVGRTVAQGVPTRLDASARGWRCGWDAVPVYAVTARLKSRLVSDAGASAREVQVWVSLAARCKWERD